MAEFKNELILQDASGVKASIDLRNALVLESAPTTATKARVGMQAYVVSSGAITAEYVCTAVSGSVYTWILREMSSGGGGSGGTFVATYDVTPYADVRAAYDAGKTVIVMDGINVYHLSMVGKTMMWFDRFENSVHSRITADDTFGWSKRNTEIIGSETGEESYRFLKTVTVTEEVTEISETFPVGYDGVIVTVENITLASGNLQLYVTAGKDSKLRGVGASLQTNRVLRFVCRKLNGTWDVFGYQGPTGDASTMIGQIGANAVSAVSATDLEGFSTVFDNINKIRVYTYSGRTLPVGMTIKIFVLGGDDNA